LPLKDKNAYREYQNSYFHRRVKAGLCKCGSEVVKGGTRCQGCRDKNTIACAATNAKTKKECFNAYGGKCVCCGESNLVFLTIDHKYGGGNEHRRQLANDFSRKGLKIFAGTRMYRWLRTQGWPAEFQILCWNCNMAKRGNSECPHKSLQLAA
jgi:hypothetical protein